jgi:hypothetical protein
MIGRMLFSCIVVRLEPTITGGIEVGRSTRQPLPHSKAYAEREER